MKKHTQEQVIELLRKRQGNRTAAEFAEELGISAPYLSDIYKGKRDPGPSVLDHLNLRKETVNLYISD